jgi:hypothetical protein
MEARDSESRIRPLPIDDLDGDAPQAPVGPRRRIAPLVAIILGALAFGVIARGLSVGGNETAGAGITAPPPSLADEPATTTTTTTTTSLPPPPALREMLPIVDDRLQILALTTTAKIGQWDADLAFPSYTTSITNPLSAGYNSDGTRLAIQSGVGGNSIVIDSATSNLAHIWDATSGVWHDTDPSLFAWTEDDAETASTVVRVADVTGDTSAGIAAQSEFRIPGLNHTLRAWGDWGFVATNGPITSGYDSDGVQQRTVDGMFFDAASDGLLLLAEPSDEGSIPFLFDSAGNRTALPALDIDADDFHITADGQWVFAVSIQDDGYTSILARTVHSRSTRLSSTDARARVVNMTWGDRLFVLQDLDSGDLLFKDWNTGAEYRVTFEHRVAAAFLPNEFDLGG